ncbi:MAG: cation:proton antiporter [Thermoplasmata archaeon]
MALLTPDDTLVLLEVFIFLALAQVVHTLTSRIGLPEIVADLLVGMTLGVYALGGTLDGWLGVPLFQQGSGLLLFADLSAILLLFVAGLGGGFSSLRRAGRYAVAAAIAGDLVPFGLVFLLMSRIYPLDAALLIAVAAAATSAAVAASLIQSARLTHAHGAQFLMNVAALDDVVALVLLSVVLATFGGELNVLDIARSATLSVAGWLVLLLVAVVVVPRLLRVRVLREVENLPFALLFVVIAVVLALGFSPIVGAYIAGLAVAESVVAQRTRRTAGVMLMVFGALFFVVVGSEFNVHLLTDPTLLIAALAIAVIAALGKVVGVYPFARVRLGTMPPARAVAVGMIPRGEIGLIVGGIGLSTGVLTQEMFGEVILMAVVTTLAGALLFRRYAGALGPPSEELLESSARPHGTAPGR